MKKVLLTKSLQIRVTTPETKMKPIAVTSPPVISTAAVRVMHMQTNVNTNTYMQRKSFQSIYEDIFKLLMRLPDKALQQRVIDAINGRSDKSAISNPNQCKHCSKTKEKPLLVNASTQTQTEILETRETRIDTPGYETFQKTFIVEPDAHPRHKESHTAAASSVGKGKFADPDATVPRKRGRKRNTCVPQVVKRSAAQMALQDRENKQLTPLQPMKRKKVAIPETSTDAKTNSSSPSPSNSSMQRRDSIASNFSAYLSDINLNDYCDQIDDYIEVGIKRTILSTMTNEFLTSHVMSEEGLLPIHDAILANNIQGLQRQVFVWSKMKQQVNFNDLLSWDEEDCLQLAITNDCEPEIVKIVLNAGVLPTHTYEESNTVLHLAVINNVKLESLRQLMMHIDLNLLLQTNDEGYTALHIAVRHNRYKMAEIICDIIDQRQLGESVYRRPVEDIDESKAEASNKSVADREEKKFAKFYERACDKLDNNKEKLMGRRLKHKIINASEARAGNAILFYAVEGELEHLCYFLLAHLSDPDEENLSGHSPKSFHYEYARLLRISLKIARIMDKVISILNHKSR